MQEKEHKKLGLYVHFPFCAQACDYCTFFKLPFRKDFLEHYLRVLQKEHQSYGILSFDTLYWGGGTPSLLPLAELELLGRLCLSQQLGLKEWTIEVTPSSLTKEKLELFAALGVTRISMGIQSFQERLLNVLGRKHPLQETYRALELLLSQKFDKSFDLIFGIPGQSLQDWKYDLEEVCSFRPEHISCYCLTYATAPFHRINEQTVIDFYQLTSSFLRGRGYQQYEISNFCLPGHECQHNVDVWEMQEWIGLGPSAASQYARRRYTNPQNLYEWEASVENLDFKVNQQILEESLLADDSLIFGLRQNKGVDLAQLQQRFQKFDFALLEDFWGKLKQEGLLSRQLNRIALTDQGRLLVDAVGARILELIN